MGYFHKQMLESAEGSPITVTGTGETIVLTGTVKIGRGIQAAGRHGADARQDRGQPAAVAARRRNRGRFCCR